ncbi:Flp pilus assembly protein TadG [Salirhabdus euzebyi]|uniref:Flp pilus assembly protein TadG n=1 Tax=Salirhabdus euzebyi TaxID=394506 RepID=A0A841Q4H9_9BACI|nr:TadE/TadG family type IV pilus assembly protein [Salirhabdus euzebyi]MBB6453321.1 Flp pilus assembly protein TadG [Salirhabdus euzebyi]
MKSEKGQSLVETALVLPVLLLILFGITDFGRIFHVYLTLDHAGREAARVATIGYNEDDIEDRAVEVAAANSITLDPSTNINITPEDEAIGLVSGSNVTITLSYSVDFLTPIIGDILNDLTLKNTTVMRVE